MPDPLIIGSETQNFEAVGFVSGIQRLVREAHAGLVDRLTPQDRRIVPLHTRTMPRTIAFTGHDYLAGDPVVHERPAGPDDVDAFLFLDVNPQIDFSAVHRSLRSRRRPVVSFVYDVIPLTRPDKFLAEEVQRFRLYLQQSLFLADHVVVTSAKVRDDLLALGWTIHAQIHVIPLGSVFRRRPPRPLGTDRLSMLYVSTIEPRKGHRELLGAFDLLRAEGFDIDLTLIGRAGWASEDLFTVIREHPDLGGRFRWLETADDGQLEAAAERCNVGVFPSQDEGFGLFLEEGLALGLKMVVSDIPVFRDREQENVSFTDSSVEGLAAALRTAQAQPWVSPRVPVRMMDDFLDDLADLILEVTDRSQE